MTRRFITRADVDELLRRGETSIEVDDRTTVTDEAREHAQRRGLRLVRSAPPGGSGRPAGDTTGSETLSPGAVRSRVRAAVIAQLGREPDGLDRALDRALGD